LTAFQGLDTDAPARFGKTIKELGIQAD